MDLGSSHDVEFQHRSWMFQRLGWGVMALVITGALLGLFGPGPLSRDIAGSPDSPIRVEYHRFWRMQSPMTLRVLLGPAPPGETQARVWLERAYMEGMRVEHVTPQPERVEAGPERLTYVFALGGPVGPTAVTFVMQPESPGVLHGRAGLASGEVVDFRQWVYP